MIDDLLSGPRGRRLCWELLGYAPFGLDRLPVSGVAEAVAETVLELRTDDAEVGHRIFEALRASVDAAMYWQEPDEADGYLTRDAVADALAPIAELVAGHPSTAWWSSPADLDTQRRVFLQLDDKTSMTAPDLIGSAPALAANRTAEDGYNRRLRAIRTGADPDVTAEGWSITSGAWWSAPNIPRVVVTARELLGTGPLGLWLQEDHPGWDRGASWPLRATRPPRVVEIDGTASWRRLVAQYPLDVSEGRGPDWLRATGRRGTWLIPDWHAVARDVDAIHLTVAGYLTTAGRIVALDGDTASLVAGWAPDATYWLTDILELSGPGTAWTGDRDTEDWIAQRR